MNIKKIEWSEALPVRHRVLWPTKPPLFCKVDGDETANHYGAFDEGQLVCVASVYIESGKARLRKFATLPDVQGRGIGTKVIEYVVSVLKKDGISCFWCDARTSATGFYEKFGLKAEGKEFERSGISYCKMVVHWSLDNQK